MSSTETFAYYGRPFQLKLLSLLLTSKQFLERTKDILVEDFFDNESFRSIFSIVHNYYDTYHDIPTMEVLVLEVKKIKNEIMKLSTTDTLKDVYTHIEDKDLEYVEEETLKFCKNQKIKNAIVESVDLLEQGNYDAIKELIDEAMIAGTHTDIGLDFNQDYKVIYDSALRKAVETPWELINNLTGGGAGKGELHVVVGAAGSGKSWFLSAIGAHALKQGKNVIHYTLELSQEYSSMRYCSLLTGINVNELKYNRETVDSTMEELKNPQAIKDEKIGKLLIKHYPDGTAGVNTLLAHNKKAEILWGKADLIIIDYADNMDPGNIANKSLANSYHIGGNIYKNVRGLAGMLEIPIWTASQSNKSGETSEVIEGNQIADSYKKLMIADFVFSLSRTKDDKVSDTGRVFIIKNRFGRDGITYPAKIDASSGNIKIFEENSLNGQTQINQMRTNKKSIDASTRQSMNEMLKKIEERKKRDANIQ